MIQINPIASNNDFQIKNKADNTIGFKAQLSPKKQAASTERLTVCMFTTKSQKRKPLN